VRCTKPRARAPVRLATAELAPRQAAFADPRPAQGMVGRDAGPSGTAIAEHRQAGTVEPAKARCSNGADGPKA
jgi:hypothetical protein